MNKKLDQNNRDYLIELEGLEQKILWAKAEKQFAARDIIKEKRSNKFLSDVITDAKLQKEVAKQSMQNLGKVIESAKRKAEKDRKSDIITRRRPEKNE